MKKSLTILLILTCSFVYGQKQITIILGSGSGGSGNALANFYLKDSTLSNDRTVDLDGKVLRFQDGGSSFVIDPVQFQSTITAGDGTSATQIYANAFTGDGNVKFFLSTATGATEVKIEGDAMANSITHTANTHIFNGNVVLNAFPRLTAPDSLYVKDADTIRSFAIADLPLPTPNLQQVTDVGYITTQPIISNAQISASGTDGIVQVSVVGSVSNIIMDVPADTYPALIFGEPGGVGSSRLKADSADGRIWQLPDASGHIPVIEGDGATPPASTPLYLGDFYIDTSAKKLYFATGTSSSADWTILN